MCRDKQIEGMAKAIYDRQSYYTRWLSDCESLATDLYNAGYRKASEVARKIFEEIEKYVEVALMNGHIETPILCIGHGTFAELKKKYTEGEKDNG